MILGCGLVINERESSNAFLLTVYVTVPYINAVSLNLQGGAPMVGGRAVQV